MGEIRVRIRLENHDDHVLFKAGQRADVRVTEIDAIVDTGAVMLLLPKDIVDTLGVEEIGKVTVTLADEQRVQMPKAGCIFLTIAGRTMFTDCLVGPPGCEALVGQIAMEELDLIPDPFRRTLGPRPESPDRPTLKMKASLAYPSVSGHATNDTLGARF